MNTESSTADTRDVGGARWRRAARIVLAIVALAATLLPIVALASSCDSRGPLVVRKVLIDVEPIAATSGIEREHVREIVDGVLKKARGIKLVEATRAEAAVLRVRVEGYGAQEPTANDGKRRSTLSLSVEVTTPQEPGGFRGHATASAAGVVEVRTLVEQGLRDALAQVIMTRGAADLDSAELIKWLQDPDGSDDLKRRAVRVLGSRRERSAVETLSRVLLGRDQDLAQLALVALTNIADPSAVHAVIKYSDRQPGPVRKQCIDAIKAMGTTEEGMAWLFVIASGHPDADVQQAAQAALDSLEAQMPKGAAVAENDAAKKQDDVARP